MVLDVDATLVTAHSEKESAAATFKGGLGYHPLGCGALTPASCWRSRCARARGVEHHHRPHRGPVPAIGQVPAAHRKRLLVRADGAGASHGLLDWLTAQNLVRGRDLQYSVGFAVTEKGPRRNHPGPRYGVDGGDRRRRGTPRRW